MTVINNAATAAVDTNDSDDDDDGSKTMKTIATTTNLKIKIICLVLAFEKAYIAHNS